VPEVFEALNNNASLPDTWVYFFYDDLEDGPRNWRHYSTITRINSESKLEYMDEPVHSDINGSWNWSDSDGFAFNTSDYHSYDGVFFTDEPAGTGKVALDIVLALDTSGSMGSDNKIQDLRAAARNFVNHPLLDGRDRVAIYRFRNGGEEPVRVQDFIACDTAGKNSLITTINSLNANGYTPLWDNIGVAVTYAMTAGSSAR